MIDSMNRLYQLWVHANMSVKKQVFSAQMKVHLHVVERSGSQVPLLKLQLSPTIVSDVDFSL